GHRAWASTEAGTWTAAKISSALAHELNSEQTTDLQGLFEEAEDIEQVTGESAVEERAAGGEQMAEYRFKAPASAFSGAEDLGDTDVEFEAKLDGKGYLTELTLHGEAEGVGATVTETYDKIGSSLQIAPPAQSEIQGTVQELNSRTDLDALLGATP